MLETREIEAFIAVAEELHFGRAAARLGLTPSRVSQTVSLMEKRVGGALFERSSRRVRLTPRGDRLLADVRPAYGQMARAIEEARRPGSTAVHVLRAGFSSPVPDGLPARSVATFEAERRDVRVVLSTHPSTDLYEWMARGRIDVDVFVTWLPADPAAVPAGLRVGPDVQHEPRALVVSPRHPLAERDHLDVEELADHDLLYPGGHGEHADAWTPARTPGGRPLRRVGGLEGARYIEEIPDIVASGRIAHLAVVSLPSFLPGADLRAIPVVGLPPIRYVAVWPSAAPSADVEVFARAAARAATEPAGEHPG